MEKDNRKILVLQVLNIVSFTIMIVLNALANTLPINNQTTGEISDKYQNLFAPAGITFAIWGLIYALLFAFVLYQSGLFTRKDKSHEKVVEQVGLLFSMSSFANALWILMWHHEMMILSLVLMVVILVCLIMISERAFRSQLDMKQKWLYRVPFSVYFGWITVATIANVTTLLVSLGWNGFGISEQAWTILVLTVAAAITITHVFLKKDAAYALVVIWALAGVMIKHVSSFESQYPGIIIAAALYTGFIASALACKLLPCRCECDKEQIEE